MKRMEIKRLYQEKDKLAEHEVTVCGWVKTLRDSKSIGFIELGDGSGFRGVQIVFEESVLSNFKEVVKLGVGAAVVVKGKVILTPQAKQPLELHALEITVEGEAPSDYPLQKKRHSLEFLRTIAYLRPRTNTFGAVNHVRSAAAYAIHRFFNENGFLWLHTPITTTSDAEGAGEMFRLTTLDAKNPPLTEEGEVDYSQDFFGTKTSLTVSGQLEAEAFALALGKVYTFGPTFRAENSNTTRHAAEFWMIEPEMAFADLADDMELAKNMIQYVLRYVLENCPDEMKFFNDFYDKGLIERLEGIVRADFAHCTYTDAIVHLEKAKDSFEYPVFWGCDLQTEHERYLTEKVFGMPVFVTDYPKEIKSFYMRVNDDKKTVAAMDLLVPGIGEMIGGSQREERIDVLEARMKECDLNPEDYEWYCNLRRFGGTKHAGFGLGFDRLIMYMTGVSNIRDVQPCPRTAGSAIF